jgi:hypothetical protein
MILLVPEQDKTGRDLRTIYSFQKHSLHVGGTRARIGLRYHSLGGAEIHQWHIQTSCEHNH